jgi:predicted membrane channel-forming protein YqfA (hemolysin III family)
VNGGGTSGYPYALVDRSVQRELLLFAAQPLAAVVAIVFALAFLGRWRSLAAGVLLAFGLEMCVLFAAHFGAAAFGNPLYNSFRAGSLLGVTGGLLVIVSGVIAFVTDPTRHPWSARDAGSPR